MTKPFFKLTLITLLAVTILGTVPACAQPAIPHSFQSIAVNPDGAALLTLAGRATNRFRQYYDLYPIEVSTDLRHWQPLTTLVRTNSSTNSLEFLDPKPADSVARYYRTPTNHFPCPYPKPTGPYPIGTFTRFFNDPARTNRFGIKGNSSLLVTFWYPAESTVGKWPAPFFDSYFADWWYGAGSDDALKITPMAAHQFSDVPCAKQGAPFPVILYSHGGYGVRKENVHDFIELASFGFIVASVDHEDCTATLGTNGRAITSAGEAASEKNFASRTADLQIIANSLTNLNASDEILQSRIDLTQGGAFGWSRGAGVALNLCMQNPQFKAFASLDGGIGYQSYSQTKSLQKPLMLFGATTVVFDYATTNAYSMQLRNATHQTYADLLPYLESPSATSRRVAATIAGCVVSFFRKHLKNEDDGLLDDPTKVYPDIYDFKKK